MRQQHDDHCVMNVNGEPWRIQWIHDDQMGVAHSGVTRVADLSKLDWVQYCANAYAHYQETQRTKAERIKWGNRHRRKKEPKYQPVWRDGADVEHVDTGESLCFATANELEDEVVNADLEFLDVQPIVEVMLERRRL